jgi:Flp pilus assembly pilin Flp
MLTDLALRAWVTLQHMVGRTRDEDGQTVAEYGLILSVVAVVTIVTAAAAFRSVIIDSINQAVDCLDGSCS